MCGERPECVATRWGELAAVHVDNGGPFDATGQYAALDFGNEGRSKESRTDLPLSFETLRPKWILTDHIPQPGDDAGTIETQEYRVMHPLNSNWISAQRLVRPLVVVAALAWAVPRASADEANSPSATVAIRSVGDLFADLDAVFGLTTTVEQEQLPIVKDFIGVFLAGVDQTLPVRIDVRFGGKYPRPIWSVPINKFDDFKNDTLLGLSLKARQKGAFYELPAPKKGEWGGWMKYAAPYASIAEKQAELPAGDPSAGLKELLGDKADITIAGENTKIDAAAQADRRKTFQESRKEILGALKKKKDEKQADFDLKKKIVEQQLDEAERFFTESQKLTVRWQTDAEKTHGLLDFELAPIAGTSLESTIAPLGTTPSYFAMIERSTEPILSGRLNHPLDEQRKKMLLDLSSTVRARAKEAADSDTALSAPEKEASKKIADLVFNMLDAGTNAGIMDGFAEVHANKSGKNTLVCGFRSADGTGVAEIIKLFPESRKGREAKLDADSEGDVKIHEVKIHEKEHPHYQDFFGGPTLYIGSSKDAVWCAAGENALAELKAAIKKRAEGTPAADPVFGRIFVKLEPWMKLREARDPKQGNPRLRKLGLEALGQGADFVHGEMRQQDKKIVGNLVIETGLLRFAGKAIADFSLENLDDRKQKKKAAAKNP